MRASRRARAVTLTQVGVAALVLCTADGLAQETEPYGAEDQAHRRTGVHIPEPMFFDLVRPLGALKGEWEANVLGAVPLGGDHRGVLFWAPEVEGAVMDLLALEFELPFEGSELEAVKVAAQYTFPVGGPDNFLHGAQGILEYLRPTEQWEVTLLYLAGYRWNRVWSGLAMLGSRFRTGLPVDLDNAGAVGVAGDGGWELLFNVTPFADVGSFGSVGVEFNLATDFDGATDILFMPQMHYELGASWMIQGGIGARSDYGKTHGEVAARLIFAF
jgi:hypothetical protein